MITQSAAIGCQPERKTAHHFPQRLKTRRQVDVIARETEPVREIAGDREEVVGIVATLGERHGDDVLAVQAMDEVGGAEADQSHQQDADSEGDAHQIDRRLKTKRGRCRMISMIGRQMAGA